MHTSTKPPVEVTTQYATTVKELSDAWAFVMHKVDMVGPDPTILIKPVWTCWHESTEEAESDNPEDHKMSRHFEVVVSGMEHEEETAAAPPAAEAPGAES